MQQIPAVTDFSIGRMHEVHRDYHRCDRRAGGIPSGEGDEAAAGVADLAGYVVCNEHVYVLTLPTSIPRDEDFNNRTDNDDENQNTCGSA